MVWELSMEKYTISKEYLDSVMDAWSRGLIGKVCKRFEILYDKEDIKKAVKELIYENVRDLKLNIRSFSYGVKFKSTPKQ